MAKPKNNVIKLTPPTEPPSPQFREMSEDEVRTLLTGLGVILKSVDSLTTQYKLTAGWLARHGITFMRKQATADVMQLETGKLLNQKKMRGQYVLHWRDGGHETFYSLREAAEFLGMSLPTLHRQIEKQGGANTDTSPRGHGLLDANDNPAIVTLRFVSFEDLPKHIEYLNKLDSQG
jgi:hypothetical protein